VITTIETDFIDVIMKNALILIIGLLILSTALPRVEAVICESFVTQEVCDRTLTSSGGCRWEGGEQGTCVNDPTRILPVGFAAIATVEAPEFLADIPSSEVRKVFFWL
jgi:hypothetical protein